MNTNNKDIMNEIIDDTKANNDVLGAKRFVLKGKITQIRKDDEKAPYDFLLATEDGKKLCCFLISKTMYDASVYAEGTEVCVLAARIRTGKIHVIIIDKFSEKIFNEMNDYIKKFNERLANVDFKSESPKEEKKVSSAPAPKKLPAQFYKLPKDIQANIAAQLMSETFEIYKSVKYITDPEAYKLKYTLCKNTYPPKTQGRIEMLMSARGGSKSSNRLHYIMNINTGYVPEKVSSDDILKSLDKVIYGHTAAKQEIASAINSATITGKGLKLLLIGPCGTGKSELAAAIGAARKKPYSIINCSSVTSIVDAAGCDSVYDNSTPGIIGEEFYKAGTTDMTMVLDEYDNLTHENRKDGDPDSVFNDMFSEKGIYSDSYLEADFNCSNTFFIACCNDESKIAPRILNRFTKIYVSDYSAEEKFTIAKSYILPKLFKEYAWNMNNDVFDDDTIRYVIENFSVKSGCRDIKNYLRKLLIKAINENRDVTGKHFSCDEIDVALDKKNLLNDPVAVYSLNKNNFSKTDQKLIEKNISVINSPDKFDGSMELAQKQLDYISDIYKHRINPPSFNYDAFIKEVDSKISGRAELKSAFARMMNYFERTGKTKNLLVIGPPGTGKTETFTAMAKAVGWPFNKISLNGVSKSEFLKGTPSFTHSGSPSEITKSLSVMGDTCILMLDEIDKIDRSQDTSVASALLDFLDSKIFKDNYLGVHIDCKKVLVVATANNENAIAPELLDRFEVIRINGYTKNEKKSIFTNYMLPRMLDDYKVSSTDYNFTDAAVDFLITKYSSTAGARELDTFAQKIVGEITMKHQKYVIDVPDIIDIIGKPPIERRKLGVCNTPGVVNGLSVNSYSGLGSLFEIQTVKSKTDKTLGMAQECLRESHQIAHTVAGMLNDNCADNCYTSLYGDGATRKDGPSAGVATTVSIISAEKGMPVPSDYAFTGEINLMGYIHAVGGVEAKIEAAQEAGCTHVFIPKDNYDYIGEDNFEKYDITVIPVSHINEVVEAVFHNKTKNKRMAG